MLHEAASRAAMPERSRVRRSGRGSAHVIATATATTGMTGSATPTARRSPAWDAKAGALSGDTIAATTATAVPHVDHGTRSVAARPRLTVGAGDVTSRRHSPSTAVAAEAEEGSHLARLPETPLVAVRRRTRPRRAGTTGRAASRCCSARSASRSRRAMAVVLRARASADHSAITRTPATSATTSAAAHATATAISRRTGVPRAPEAGTCPAGETTWTAK